MIEILKQGPRLHVEASERTADVNEAYLMVHNALALAINQNTAPPLACDNGLATRRMSRRRIGLSRTRPIDPVAMRCPPAH